METTTPYALKQAFEKAIQAQAIYLTPRPTPSFVWVGKGVEPTGYRRFKIDQSGIEEVPAGEGLYSQGEQFFYFADVVMGIRGLDEDEEQFINSDAVMIRKAMRDRIGPEPGLVGVQQLGISREEDEDFVRIRYRVDFMADTGILGTTGP